MSDDVHYLKAKLNERLAAMAREVSELFDGLVALHEREMQVLKLRNMRQQQILDSVLKPRVILHRADPIQIVSHRKGEVGSQLDVGITTELPHIKEEHEELFIKMEQEEFTEFPYSSVKSEEDNKPVFQLHLSPPDIQDFCLRSDSQLHLETVKMEKSFDLKDMEESQDDLSVAHRSSLHFQSDNDAQTQNSSDTDDSHEWDQESHSDGHKSKNGGINEVVNDDEIVFECYKCLKTFLRKGVKHTLENDSKGKGLTCSACSVVSRRQGKCPRKVHSGRKPIICEVCEKGFTREDNLNTHMLIHKGERPHTCTVCNKSFTEAGHLKTHIRIHTGEKPFSCSLCRKCFTHRATRDRHERSHSGKRPYSCSECGTEFKQKAHYLSHLQVHSRERPYSCPVCNKNYKRNSHVTSHMKVHTRKPIQCEKCDEVFKAHSSFKKHMKSHLTEEAICIT
ncbi:gastrula zinc finger protein XlCGF57.1-like [Boleophthalmus pectinirostris]|uniref:gastrula zinc finger protein XlCGF57.1-like n=1 Tax=Boleophthalmus pectinirostris TaxID=150288 RepID=UPI00242B5A74|nr:gastrula zinc finger protein XlCGF57.1-like [Boleophthalmus pectinirostris]